ncbi:hypothetical protein Tco_0668537, partial [Tanacetum coccineum]
LIEDIALERDTKSLPKIEREAIPVRYWRDNPNSQGSSRNSRYLYVSSLIKEVDMDGKWKESIFHLDICHRILSSLWG